MHGMNSSYKCTFCVCSKHFPSAKTLKLASFYQFCESWWSRQVIRVSAFMGTVHICLSCTLCSHTSCQHVAVSERAATCTVGSFGSQVELRVMAVDSRQCRGSWDYGGGTEQGGPAKNQSLLVHALLCLSSVACFYLCFTLKKWR